MKKLLQYGIVAGACIMLSACPYESMVPIDEPTEKLDERLVGRWRHVSDIKEKEIVTINKVDDQMYKIEMGNKNDTTYQIQAAWLSTVDGRRYLNIKDESKPVPSHNFMQIVELSKKRFIYRAIDEGDKKVFSNSADLKKWISDNQNKPGFYQDNDTLIRVGR